jgi:hypothetical protein
MRARPSPGVVASLPLFLYALITLPAVLGNVQLPGSVASDARQFHIPQIDYFIQHPADIVHYPGYAPTLPGYHLLLAAVARALGHAGIGDATMSLRLFHWLLALGAVATALYLAARVARERWTAPILMLPFVVSWYTVQSGIFYGTELPALLCCILLLLAVERGAVAGAALAATGMVFVRQMFAPVIFVPVLASVLSRERPSRSSLRTQLLVALPALLLIAFYVAQWGGLVPPGIAAELNKPGLYPFVWLHALAFCGVFAVLFAPLRLEEFLRYLHDPASRFIRLPALLLALLLWLATPSDFDPQAGRWGSLVWSAAAHGPLFFHRSPIVLFLALLGAAYLGFAIRGALLLPRFPVELAAAVLYMAGLALSAAAYQRYVEPVLLLCLGVLAARSGIAPGRRASRLVPLLAGAGVYLVFALQKLYLGR